MDQTALDQMNKTLSTIKDTLTSVSTSISTIVGGIPGISDVVNVVGKSADDTAQSLQKMTEATQRANIAGNNQVRVTSQQKNSITGLVAGLRDHTEGLLKQAQVLQGTRRGTELMADGMGLLASAAGVATDSLSDFTDNNNIGSKSILNTAQSISSLTSNLNKLNQIPGGSAIAATLRPLTEIAGNFAAATAQVDAFENSVLSTLGSFGGFKDINRIDFIGNLDRSLTMIIRQNAAVAGSTNLATKEITAYAKKIMEIPGAYQQMIDLTSAGSNKMSLLEGATRLARGTTGNFSDTLESVNLQFRQFGQISENSLDFMAKTYAVSQKLGVSFEDMNGTISGVVKQFAMFGDNMESSINLVGALTRSLKDTGLGIEPTTQIVQNITKSLYGLSEAQKAVISAQTGGPGGLRGAFQIDQMMSEGRMDEVYQKMEQSLRQQFGGRIVSREEAAGSDTAAAQMQQQIQFLTSGPFGQIVGDRAQAMKLLEAMKGPGGIDSAAMGREIESGLSNAMNADKAIQDRQYNVQTAIANHTQMSLQELQIMNAMNLRQRGRDFNLDDVVNQYIAKSQSLSKKITSGQGTMRPVDALLEDINTAKEMVFGTNQDKGITQATAAGARPITSSSSGIVSQVTQGMREYLSKSKVTQAGPEIPTRAREEMQATLPETTSNGVNGTQFLFAPLQVDVTLRDSAGAELSRQRSQARIEAASGIPSQ